MKVQIVRSVFLSQNSNVTVKILEAFCFDKWAQLESVD